MVVLHINRHEADKILEVSPTATAIQIKTAYKKAALKWHPDRVPEGSKERPERTRKFQKINDAYYTLSDPARRKDYDEARRFGFTSHQTFDDPPEEAPRPGGGDGGGAGTGAGMGGFPWSWFFGNKGTPTPSQEEKFSNEQFGSVFEEMMQDEGFADETRAPTTRFWSIVGAVSGAGLGFITANVVGAVTGFVAGERLGRIRDAKGKSVLAVYKELDPTSKSKLLSELATKVFASAVTG